MLAELTIFIVVFVTMWGVLAISKVTIIILDLVAVMRILSLGDGGGDAGGVVGDCSRFTYGMIVLGLMVVVVKVKAVVVIVILPDLIVVVIVLVLVALAVVVNSLYCLVFILNVLLTVMNNATTNEAANSSC